MLHLGDGDWVVIDSLLNDQAISAPLAYLSSLGADLHRLRAIVATHWHDDHVKGLAELYAAAPTARLIMSLAMQKPEFAAFAKASAGDEVGDVTSGVSEMAKLLAVRKAQGRPAAELAVVGRTIYRKRARVDDKDGEIVLTALSPCDADVNQFLTTIQPPYEVTEFANRPTAFTPNDSSVATWLGFPGDSAVLLGADVETVGAPDRGWNAILASPLWPRAVAAIFKLAHHGSQNGHHPQVWTDLLEPDAIATLAPFNKGLGVPKQADVNRLKALTPNAYSTTQAPFRRHASRFVERSLEAAGIKVKSAPRRVGAIRLRRRMAAGEEWSVELFGGAVPIDQFVART